MDGHDYFKFKKRRDFFTSYDNQVLLVVILQRDFPFCTEGELFASH